jgi:uncharacterized protein YbaP (TraB family)
MYRLLILIMYFGYCQLSWGAGERLPIWKISAGDADVVLLGSVHMAFADIYPLRQEIEDAYAAADQLVVEVDIGGANAVAIQQNMFQRGLLPAGEVLSEKLSEPVWKALEKYLRSRGLPIAGFQTLRPGLVVLTLTTMRLMEMGMDPELGIDQHFLKAARGNKPILELETAQQQIDLLLNFPDANLIVEQTLGQLDSIDLYMRPIYEAWKAGDANALNRLLLEDELAREPRYKAFYESMFDNRNYAMAQKIADYLAGSGRYFIVVGAGHLVGEKGIIALLERRGFSAQQL